jgi:small-conductance mechanosensitive channel/CRP-like cAMP-binding protein
VQASFSFLILSLFFLPILWHTPRRMTLTPEFVSNFSLAVGLGLAIAVLLWLLRRYALVRRIRLSALLTVLLLSVYASVQSAGWFAPDSFSLKLLLSVTVLLAANTLLQIFDWVAWDYVMGQRRHIAVPRLVADIFNLVVLAAVAAGLLRFVFGVADLSGLLFTSTVLSAVVGLALQDTLGNVITGVALQLEQPFSVSDWVKLSDQEGQITQMNWRSITLRTRDNHNVFIPNANVAKQLIINFSRPTPLQRMHAFVSVAYSHPPEHVKAVLVHGVAEAQGVCAAPAPQVIVSQYGEFAVHYDIRYWITDFARALDIHDAVMTRVWYALQRANLSIPFPVRDVTVKMLGDDHEARTLAGRQREVMSALRPLPIFAPLNDAQVAQLAGTATRQRFATGERLVRQGEAGDSLFVITKGRVRVEKQLDDGQTLTLAHLEPDEFIGEMSLLTGEPRSASVVAETETEVVVVSKAGLSPVIAADGRIAEAFSLALMTRARNVADVVAKTGPLAAKPDRADSDLLARIRRFFGVG